MFAISIVYSGVEIAMEQQTYEVNEATNATVTVCAALTLGTLERDVTVMLSSRDGTATATGMYKIIAVWQYCGQN